MIDQICDRYEATWHESGCTSMAEFVTDVAPEHRDALIKALIRLDIELRQTAGLSCSLELYAGLGDDACEFADREIRISQESKRRLAETFLVSSPPADSVMSKNVGPFRILQSIGKGGMGQVFLAEQTEPVKRRVALKVIKTETPTREVLARFEAERQALAMMNHQHIAKVLDAGITEDGRPYFAMELVKGISITEYCDRNRLLPEERLNLFVQTCRAIQHAHMKGIVHRDLKPSNIMVTLLDGKPVAKVIDFGLAKALQESNRLTDRTLFTQYGQIVGTLAYMSPEQAEMNSLDIDTRTDVYSLGVVLFELLTGSTPITGEEIRTQAFDRILALIREQDVTRPSQRLSESGAAMAGISERRRTEPKRLGDILKGDLDWIAVKACEKDRTRRYDTPAALADDVERYLRGEAIEARPPSLSYLLRKMLLRNKGSFAAAGISLASLVLGLLVTAALWVQADRDRLKAERAEAASLKAEAETRVERDRAQEAREHAESLAREASARKRDAEDARANAEMQTARAEAERQVAVAVRAFLQNDILKQASIYEQAISGVDTIDRSLTVKQALMIAAEKFSLTEITQVFPEQPEVQSEILGTLAESLSVVGEHALAVRCSLDRLSILERDALQRNLKLPPALVSARVEHLFFLVNAKKSVEAARQYAQSLTDLESVLQLTLDDFPDPKVSLDNEIDTRTAAIVNCFQRRLDPTKYSVDQWLSAQPSFQEQFAIVAAVTPTLGQPQRIYDLMKRRYPPDDARVLYSRLTVATESHAGADIAANSSLGGIALSLFQRHVSYDTAIEIYRELLEIGEAQLKAGRPSIQDTEMKLAGVRFMMGVALSDQSEIESEKGYSEIADKCCEEACQSFERVGSVFEKRLGRSHPTMLMVHSYRISCLRRLGRHAEAIPDQERMVTLCSRYYGIYRELDATEDLADLHLTLGKADPGSDHLHTALQLYEGVLNGLEAAADQLRQHPTEALRSRCRKKQITCTELLAEAGKAVSQPSDN